MESCAFYRGAIFILFMSAVCSGMQWNVTPGDFGKLNVCQGHNVSLNWKFALGQGEQLEDIKWYYTDHHTDKMIAMYSDGHFIPTPVYSGRVSLHDNAGLVLDHVMPEDTGSYSVKVHVLYSSGIYANLQDTVSLNVTDHCSVDTVGSPSQCGCKQEIEELRQSMNSQLTSLADFVSGRPSDFLARYSSHISFHARLSSDKVLGASAHLAPDEVLTNEGNGYNSSTGEFTAPVNGTYIFFASVGTAAADRSAKVYMMADESEWLCYTYSQYTDNVHSSYCQAVVYLMRGQRVWLRVVGESYFWYLTTSFSGFLLYA